LIAGAVYYVKTVLTADTFTVSLTANGTVINTTSPGSGTHRARTGKDNNAGFAYTNYGSNTQAANSRSIAVLTIQRAIDAATSIDLAGYKVTIQLAPGRYADLAVLKSYVGVGPIIIQGDTSAATNYQLEPYGVGLITNANASSDKMELNNHGLSNGTPIAFVMYSAKPVGFLELNRIYYVINATTNDFQVSTTVGGSAATWTNSSSSVYACAWTVTSPAPNGKYVMRGLQFIASTGGMSIRPTRCVMDIDTCNFGGRSGNFGHVFAEVNSMVTFQNTNTISASTTDVIAAWDGAYVTSRLSTFLFSGTLTFSSVFRGGRTGVLLMDQTTYTVSGSVDSAKYNLASNAVLQGPSTSIPGTRDNTKATGGEFIDFN
jgi:hypothetical protein